MINFQEKLKYYLTGVVKDEQRVFKLVDGTKPLYLAHVFFTGSVKNLGNRPSDYKKMYKKVQDLFNEWYNLNKAKVDEFYAKELVLNNYQEIKP